MSKQMAEYYHYLIHAIGLHPVDAYAETMKKFMKG